MKKIPTKHEEKKPFILFRWLTNLSRSLAGRYVNDCHPVFMQYLAVNNIATASIWNDARSRRYKEIMKILDSDKYRKFFYKAISYNPKNREYEKPEVKWYVKIFDKVIYHLSKAYVFVFERELYKKIKTFETVSAGVASLTKRMDEYIAKTTPEQRLSRMQALGIISYESFKDDLDVIFNRISPDVIEARNIEKYSTPGTFGAQWSRKKLPDSVSKVIADMQK